MGRESKRKDLIDRGLDLVHRRGFANSGVASIAEAAGAPKGSFYNHFKSKEDFGNAVLARYFDDVLAGLNETLQRQNQHAYARLHAYFERLRTYNATHDFARGCLIGNLGAEASSIEESMRENVDRMLAQWSARIAQCLAEGQRDGSVRKTASAETLARLVLDAWQGVVLRSKVERSSKSQDDFISVLLPRLVGTELST